MKNILHAAIALRGEMQHRGLWDRVTVTMEVTGCSLLALAIGCIFTVFSMPEFVTVGVLCLVVGVSFGLLAAFLARDNYLALCELRRSDKPPTKHYSRADEYVA